MNFKGKLNKEAFRNCQLKLRGITFTGTCLFCHKKFSIKLDPLYPVIENNSLVLNYRCPKCEEPITTKININIDIKLQK